MELMKKIAALFVEERGVYFDLKGVEPWGIEKNALNYKGPYKAICHPPCKRWGRYWSGGPSSKKRLLLGNDSNMFAHSLWVVRTFGGIIEHPEASHAWKWFGLKAPPKSGGWVEVDNYGGFGCCVEQGHYGHKARKATWIYANGVPLIDFKWGTSGQKMKMELGPHSKEEAREIRSRPDYRPEKRLSAYERLATPVEFRDLLIKCVKTK